VTRVTERFLYLGNDQWEALRAHVLCLLYLLITIGKAALSFVHFLCSSRVISHIFLGQAWAEGKGEIATCRHRADSGQENGQNMRRHSLDRLYASINKQKKSGCR